MKLHILTSKGIDVFRQHLQSSRDGQSPNFGDLLQAPGLTVEVPTSEDIRPVPPGSKRELGEYLVELLKVIGGTPEDILKNTGLWAWLSLYWIDTLAPRNASGLRDVKSTYRWIPESDNYQNYYRHPLALPYRACVTYPNGATADVLLAGPITKPGELTEQLASSQEIFSSSALLGAATKLYIDPVTRAAKPNAAGKDVAGSARRFAAVVNQLARTWDLSGMNPDTVIAKLPAEFDAFR